MSKPCEVCEGEGWICIDHEHQVWDSWHQLMCEGGKPCVCNKAHENNLSQNDQQVLKEFDEADRQFNGYKKGG